MVNQARSVILLLLLGIISSQADRPLPLDTAKKLLRINPLALLLLDQDYSSPLEYIAFIGQNFLEFKAEQSQLANLTSKSDNKEKESKPGPSSKDGPPAVKGVGKNATADRQKGQETHDNEKPNVACFSDLFWFKQDLEKEELWALQMYDAMFKPGTGILELRLGLYGNLDQCEDVKAPPLPVERGEGFVGKYFNVRFLLNNKNIEGPFYAKQSVWIGNFGFCLPDTCREEDALILTVLGLRNIEALPYIVPVRSERIHMDSIREVSGAAVGAIVLLSILSALVVIATAKDYLIDYLEKRNRSEESGCSIESAPVELKNGSMNPAVETANEKTGLVTDDSFSVKDTAERLLASFSIRRNGPKVMASDHAPGSVTCLNGIKFISTVWVLLTHCNILAYLAGNDTKKAAENMKTYHYDDILIGNTFSVDTFFIISGFLVGYLKFKQMFKKGLESFDWKMFLIHRFCRLTPTYMIVILLHLGLARFMVSGSAATSYEPYDRETCEDKWWQNLLYISNFHNDKMCMRQTWYLPVDMQYHVLSLLFIFPLFLRFYAGLALTLLVLLGSWIATGVVVSEKDYVLSDFMSIVDYGDRDRFKYYYQATYTRIGPFIVGILAGYLLARLGGKVEMKWPAWLSGWVVSLSLLLTLQFSTHDDITDRDNSSTEGAALFLTVSRTLWGAGVAWVIIACHSGYGGWINGFLSWRPFVFFNRLCYLIYLVHYTLIACTVLSLGQAALLTPHFMMALYCFSVAASMLVSFVLQFLVEMPMMEIENVLLPRK